MSLAKRILCIALVREATQAGARRSACCELLELSIRTLERWEQCPEVGDLRKGPLAAVAHALSAEEKRMIIEVSNTLPYRDLSLWQIVAKLADSGQYLASESSFYRVLRKNDLLSHRSKNSIRKHNRPEALVARKPNEVYSWDITYLKSPVKGRYYYLYLVMDIYSYRVEESETAEFAADLIDECYQTQKIKKINSFCMLTMVAP